MGPNGFSHVVVLFFQGNLTCQDQSSLYPRETLSGVIHTYAVLGNEQNKILNSQRFSELLNSGFLAILRINEFGNVMVLHFFLSSVDSSCQYFSGSIMNGCAGCFSGEKLYKFMLDTTDYDIVGPVKNFIGSIRSSHSTVYLAVCEKYPSNVLALSYDFMDIENINKYHAFDVIGKQVSMDLTKLHLSDLRVIAVDAGNRRNPFTSSDCSSIGDFLFMMSYSATDKMKTTEFFVFSENIQRVKMACLCKGSEAGWNTYLEKFSREYSTSFFDTVYFDINKRSWRSNIIFRMYVEHFQEVQ